jgi:nitrite reductase/ring-hydroxylating ferredoxin subunit
LKPDAKIENERETKTCWSVGVLVQQNVFCYHPAMQSFDTKQTFIVGRIEDIPPSACVSFELPDGSELAVYNVDGEFYATENFCPHKGALLSEGTMCGHIVECGWHGWQFDVRSGECLTVKERIKTYEVVVEDGFLKVILNADDAD